MVPGGEMSGWPTTFHQSLQRVCGLKYNPETAFYICPLPSGLVLFMFGGIVRKLLLKKGYHLAKGTRYNGSTSFQIKENHYAVVLPYANYAPWAGDPDFTDVYRQIKGNTLVDIYRCYELWDMAGKIATQHPEACFLEVGVWRGGTAAILGRRLEKEGSTIPFYLADTFEGVPKSSAEDTFYNDGEHRDTDQNTVERLLKNKYGHFKILKGIFPEDTAHLIPEDRRFGLCHIDVDVYNSARDIVHWIWDRLVPGGIIVFDDYGFHTCDGITRYVNELRKDKNKLILHNLNGHAVIVKVA